jgi:hypothetical protein
VHELLPALLAPLKLKGAYCDVAVLNASDACLSAMEQVPPQAEEVVIEDCEALKVMNAHIGHLVRFSCKVTD